MTSAYLSLPLRSLRELRDQLAAEVSSIEARQEAMILTQIEADMELRFEDGAQIGDQIHGLTDRLGTLLDRLDTIANEIAHRERPNPPIVL